MNAINTNERPILFNGPMVQAILAGRKTQTRRIVKPQPKVVHGINADGSLDTERIFRDGGPLGNHGIPCPYGQPGDRLWVREKFATNCLPADENHGSRSVTFYAADNSATWPGSYPGKWRPSIHMPRAYSRITLEIVNVRVERLKEISEADAKAEGCPLTDPQPFVPGYGAASASGWFSDLWESINGPGSWDANPWVWVVEFERIQT